MIKTTIAPLLLIAVIALAACGGNSDSGGGSKSGGGSGESAQSGSKPDKVVDMKNVEFHPMAITIKKGQTIRWTNSDGFSHTVTKSGGPGPKFDSGDVGGGDTYQRKFDATGTIDYVCTIHPNQKGTIKVE